MVRRFGAVTVCLIALAACSAKPASRVGARATSSPSVTASQIVARAVSAMQALTSYRVVSVVSTRTGKGALVVKVDSSFEAPDRVRTSTTIGGHTVETITIAGQTWIRDPTTGVWKRKITASPSTTRSMPFAFLSVTGNALLARHETLDGAEAFVIEAEVPAMQLLHSLNAAGAGSGMAKITLWIDAGTFRLLKVAEAATQPITIDATLSSFNTRFGIAVPH